MRGGRRAAVLACVWALAVAGATPAGHDDDAYLAGLRAWRAEREATLRAEDGWLSVAGLFFLEPGANTFGAGSSNAIVLPKDAAPDAAGTFTLKDSRVFFDLAAGVTGRIGGEVVQHGELRPTSAAPPRRADVLRLGRLSLLVHRSGTRLAIRLRDPEGPVRSTFTGTRWFEVDSSWRVEAAYVAFPVPERTRILNVAGDQTELASPGMVTFSRAGNEYSLRALEDGDGLWFVFSDRTAGTETYEAARFLYTPLPKDGRVVLDFNRAENPPCAYNPYTTCPLPPKENRLPLAVRAGERAYPDKYHPQ